MMDGIQNYDLSNQILRTLTGQWDGQLSYPAFWPRR